MSDRFVIVADTDTDFKAIGPFNESIVAKRVAAEVLDKNLVMSAVIIELMSPQSFKTWTANKLQ